MQEQNTTRRYAVDPESGCWLWQGTLNGQGYGAWGRAGAERVAHREFYLLHVGPIPEGHGLHHTCATKHCVNPAHLLPVTQAEHSKLEGPFTEQVERAQELRQAGLSYPRIAAELGCSRTTAYRLVNPDYYVYSRDYHRDRSEHYAELRVTYRKRLTEESPTRCVRCGAGMLLPQKSEGLCIACRHEDSKGRKRTVQRMWLDGRSMNEIAEALRSTRGSVGQTMVQMRREGWELPRRYKTDEHGRRLPGKTSDA